MAHFREFVTALGSHGAGPGYGLLSPLHPAQRPFIAGRFDASAVANGAEPRGILALADHGCTAVSFLVLEGTTRGEVWIDARSNEEGVHRIAPSFRDYYLDWLHDAVGDHPPARVIDPERCAMPQALSRYLEDWEKRSGRRDAQAALADLADGSVATTASSSPFFADGDPVALCAGCRDMAHRLHMRPALFAPGLPPNQGR